VPFLSYYLHFSTNSEQINKMACESYFSIISYLIKPFLFFLLQIGGPFSFRVESSIAIDPRSQDHFVRVDDSIFAIDWALKVLGSAKATAWYSPKHQEAMVELRFFEA
jgi:hypothetical protein